MEYLLYAESGPRRRKTMVHVLDLLGCIAQGPTTEEALENTPDAIRAYLRFLKRHGEAVESEAAFTTRVAEHVMEGTWLGNGNPTPGFAPDFGPLSVEDLNLYLHRLDGIRKELLALVRDVPTAGLLAEPESGGRPLYAILEHVVQAEATYLRTTVGKVEGLPEALREVQPDSGDLPAALSHVWELISTRFAAMTETERTQAVPHGQTMWTARRAMRRALEHEWEHFCEIERRLK